MSKAMPGSELLEPAVLNRAQHLGLEARQIVEGYRVGEHRSPLHGFAIEFSQHREYGPGDDTRHLDWKLLAKSEKLFIKQYEQDTNFVAHILVDGSESMAFSSKGKTKFQTASVLAACLSYLILSQGDAVTFSLFDNELRDRLPRTDSQKNVLNICEMLINFEPSRPTNIEYVLNEYSLLLQKRGIVVLLSDLLTDPNVFLDGLRRLSLKRSEVIVFQILDHTELNFDLKGNYRFKGLEATGIRSVNPVDLQIAYMKAFDEHQKAIRRSCEICGVHHHLINTERPLAEALSSYMASRRAIR